MSNAVSVPVNRQEANSAIRKHDRLIRYLARRFTGSGVSVDDLIQEGRIALWRALATFEPSRGVALWTYARRFVFGAMLHCASEHIASLGEPLDTLSESEEARETVETAYLIRECLSALTDKEERLVLQLFLSGETFEAIAASTDQSDRNVRRIFQSAVKTIQKRLEVGAS